MIRLLAAAVLLLGATVPALACQWGRAAWEEPQRRAAAAHPGEAAAQPTPPPATTENP